MVSEWLKLMLEEIRRKQREREEAARERQRRVSGTDAVGSRPPGGGGRD